MKPLAFDSWIARCAKYHGDCKDPSKCTGCSLSETRNESFPIFRALLDAIHTRKIKVQILTNNYSVPTCKNKTTLLDWLAINEAEIRMYQTTSFLHIKFIMIDGGKKVLVSSVNFSNNSFKNNRETGVVVSDCISGTCDAMELYKSVFNYDWQQAAKYIITNEYSDEQKKYITEPLEANTKFTVKQIETFKNTEIVMTYVAPDYARTEFFEQMNQTKHSLLVHIYVISDKENM